MIIYLDPCAKPTLGPTQGQYSLVVAIIGAFDLPPADVRLIRVMSTFDLSFSKIPIEMTFFNVTVTMLRTFKF